MCALIRFEIQCGNLLSFGFQRRERLRLPFPLLNANESRWLFREITEWDSASCLSLADCDHQFVAIQVIRHNEQAGSTVPLLRRYKWWQRAIKCFGNAAK